jgi:hypothetical protein
MYHSSEPPVLYDGGAPESLAETNLVSLVPNYWVEKLKGLMIFPAPFKFLHRAVPIPKTMKWSPSDRHYYLFEPLFAHGWAHSLLDNVLPGYRALRLVGLSKTEISNSQFVAKSSCTEIFEKKEHANACQHFFNRTIEFCSSRALTSVKELAQGQNICFPNVVIGAGGGSFQTTDAMMLKDWTSYTRSRLRVSPGISKDCCVMIKKGRRSFANYDEILSGLATRFPSLVIRPLRNFHKLSSTAQIEEIQRCKLLITPCGGASLIANYMLPGSSVIIVNYFDVHANRSGLMEGHFFSQCVWLKVLHYPLEKSEVTIDCSFSDPADVGPNDNRSYFKYRNCGVVTLNLSKLFPMVAAVIEEERHM